MPTTLISPTTSISSSSVTTQSSSTTTTTYAITNETSSVSTTTPTIKATEGTADTLSGGGVAGIVIGVLATTVIILGIVAFVYIKRRRSHRKSDEIPYLPDKDELERRERLNALAIPSSERNNIQCVPDTSDKTTQNADYVNIDFSGKPSDSTDPNVDTDGYMKKITSTKSKQKPGNKNMNIDKDANNKKKKSHIMHRPSATNTSAPPLSKDSDNLVKIEDYDAKSQTTSHHNNQNKEISDLNDSQKHDSAGRKHYYNLNKANPVVCEDHQKELLHSVGRKNVDSTHHLPSVHQGLTSTRNYANVKGESADSDKTVSSCAKSKHKDALDVSNTEVDYINEEDYVNVNKIPELVNKILSQDQDELYEN